MGNLLFWAYLAPLVGGWLGSQLSFLRTVTIAGAATLATGYALAATNQPSTALAALHSAAVCSSPVSGRSSVAYIPSGQIARRHTATITSRSRSAVCRLRSSARGCAGHFGFWAVFAVCATAAAAAGLALAAGWGKLQPRRESIAEAVIDGATVKAQWGKLAGLLAGAVVFFAAFQQQQTTLVIWARDVCHVKYPETLSF